MQQRRKTFKKMIKDILCMFHTLFLIEILNLTNKYKIIKLK